jgi:hypothetical protein
MIYLDPKKISNIFSSMCVGLHVKYPLLLWDFDEILIFSTDSRKKTHIQFHAGKRTDGRTDGRTNGETDLKLAAAFRNFANSPKKSNSFHDFVQTFVWYKKTILRTNIPVIAQNEVASTENNTTLHVNKNHTVLDCNYK